MHDQRITIKCFLSMKDCYFIRLVLSAQYLQLKGRVIHIIRLLYYIAERKVVVFMCILKLFLIIAGPD